MGWTVFDQHAVEYDRWYDEHGQLYRAEVNALSRFIPLAGLGVEIGIGTGRFAVPFGIRLGIEPSRRMAEIAQGRGLAVCLAVSEALPVPDGRFDFVLLVTVICFVGDVPVLLREVWRVLKPGGRLIVGFIDRNSALGQLYESRKESDEFYHQARFYSAPQVGAYTLQVGFDRLEFCQTLFGLPRERPEIEPVRDGYGEGAFVVLNARKREQGGQ
jgi:SAM-dependent methyltransferase